MTFHTTPNRVRELRQKRGMSQRGLAQIAGLHHPAITHIEAGRRIPTFQTMKKIADALQVHVSDIFS